MYIMISHSYDKIIRSIAEKMCFGGILLEGYNDEFWVALGCLSDHTALKQHALIRGLNLDVSLTVAWAYLGKVISTLCKKHELNECEFSVIKSLGNLIFFFAGNRNDSQNICLPPKCIFSLMQLQC